MLTPRDAHELGALLAGGASLSRQGERLIVRGLPTPEPDDATKALLRRNKRVLLLLAGGDWPSVIGRWPPVVGGWYWARVSEVAASGVARGVAEQVAWLEAAALAPRVVSAEALA